MGKSGVAAIALFLLFTVSTVALVAQKKDSMQVRYVAVAEFDSTRNPAKDVQDAVVEAKRTGKRILLDVGGNWCKWCHYLDNFWEKNKDVADFLHEKFIYVKVNFSKGNENKDFLSTYPKIPGTRIFLCSTPTGRCSGRRTPVNWNPAKDTITTKCLRSSKSGRREINSREPSPGKRFPPRYYLINDTFFVCIFTPDSIPELLLLAKKIEALHGIPKHAWKR